VYYPDWLPFEEWCRRGGRARARFWETQGWANLQRATYVRWTLRRRHWPESCLDGFMADLSDELPPAKRRKRKPKVP
jgi:hypothetical protein